MTEDKAINIAIDGYSSTGKSTLARELAALLGYRYIDTGAMYRAVTLYAVRAELIENGVLNDEKLSNALDDISLEFHHNAERDASDIFLNGENVEPYIRKMEVARYVSDVAAVSAVRHFLVEQQKTMAHNKKVVMDGRDIGTVVLPEAELKIFVTANRSVRVMRRFEELKAKGENVTRMEIEANLEQRDLIDTTREDSPLKRADDALILDNSELTREEQLQLAYSWAMDRLTESAEQG